MPKLNIKSAARAHDISMIELAERLGITRQTLYTHCVGNPSADIICRIAEAIGCSVSELFGESISCSCPHCGKAISIKIEG